MSHRQLVHNTVSSVVEMYAALLASAEEELRLLREAVKANTAQQAKIAEYEQVLMNIAGNRVQDTGPFRVNVTHAEAAALVLAKHGVVRKT